MGELVKKPAICKYRSCEIPSIATPLRKTPVGDDFQSQRRILNECASILGRAKLRMVAVLTILQHKVVKTATIRNYAQPPNNKTVHRGVFEKVRMFQKNWMLLKSINHASASAEHL